MITMKRSCLHRDEIELVLSGRLSPVDFDTAIAHLGDCDVCRSAAESFQQDGDWMIGDACEIVRQAALGLTHVHLSGLVHRESGNGDYQSRPTSALFVRETKWSSGCGLSLAPTIV